MLTVVTDLDGTLLDHDSYRFDAAQPALNALRERGIPLILATSKTLAETARINARLGQPGPVIVENGGVIAFPETMVPDAAPAGARAEWVDGYWTYRLGPAYVDLRRFIDAQREARGYRLTGFGDLSILQIEGLTGLDPAEARLSRRRLCSEPFLWHDSEDALARFTAAAAGAGFALTRGGRFLHLVGHTGKAAAIDNLRGLLDGGATPSSAIVLGDSENDRAMLEAADTAVVVKRPDGSHLDCRGRGQTLYTDEPGPAGWNVAILQLLDGTLAGGTGED